MTATAPSTNSTAAPRRGAIIGLAAALDDSLDDLVARRVAELAELRKRVPVDQINPWTVMSGALIVSAILARAMAWLEGSTTVAQLALLLVIAVAAAATGRRAAAAASNRRLDVVLSRLCSRAGLVQTALGVVTLVGALFSFDLG